MPTIQYDHVRSRAARHANEEDASLWRWFCVLYEEGRIRWCRAAQGWLVSVDHKHLATEPDFDTAIRMARERFFSGRRAGESQFDR
ncbi:hypothetical protein [Paraburkholderia fungorum]|uniref:hypothetical protein n=1 Tax=Paraburkholderia fungorum TaxID=134537 RepID=UPI0020978A8C|nr:hypothetical protein [Paraburkholderia fungorum]USX06779.1 hypothetical protein NHH62_18165 [Paraburkholderia fungorum]